MPWRAPRGPGISLSWAMAKLTRTAVLMAARVVPSTARPTVTAITSMRAKPLPPSMASPMSRTMSPMGALEAAAAAMPVVLVPSAATLTSFSHTA